MANKSIITILLIISILSCKKTAPQYPSNKEQPIDSIAAAMTAINQHLAIKEDSLLGVFVRKYYPEFQKSKYGFWFHIIKATDKKQIAAGSKITVEYEIFNTERKLLDKQTFAAETGKTPIPEGLRQGILLMRSGETAMFVVPWYLAYGMRGNSKVPPYTSVIYKVVVL